MRIRILERLSEKFSQKIIFLVLSFLVVVLCLVALEELGPFYGYGLNGTIVQVIAQHVSEILRAVFQFSQDLYKWYAFTWIYVVVVLSFVALTSLCLSFFFSPRLKEKHDRMKLFIYLRRVLALNGALGLCKRLTGLVKETSERLKKKSAEEGTTEGVSTRGREWKTYTWQISLIFTLALILFTYRYALFPVPQGWDTWQYVGAIKDMRRDFNAVTINLPRALSLIFMYVMTAVSGLMVEQVMVLLTPLMGIIYMVGVYLLVLTGVKNKATALLAALYTPLTFGTLFLSAGFYSNFLALGFAMYALTLYIKTMETKGTRIRYIVPTAMMFALTAFTHVWTFEFLTALVLVHNLLELLTTGECRKIIQRTLIIYAPTIVIFVTLNPNLIIAILGTLGLFTTSNPWENASRENPYILLLAIIGIIAITKHKGTVYTRLVFSWTMLTSAVLITGISYFSYRIMCVVPLAILAAHGTQVISKRLTQHLDQKSTGKLVLPLIFLLSFTAMIPYSYLPEAALTPSNEAMQQLYWIEQNYGYGNRSIIVCFDKIPSSVNGLYYSDYYYWGEATVGGMLYDAPVLYLIQGLADRHGNSFLDYAGKTIIIPDAFYRMTPLEYKASRKISDLGLYEVQIKNIKQIDRIIRNESIWLKDDFQKEEWKPNPPWVALDYTYQVNNESNIMNISVTPLHPDKWFDVETQLPAPIHPTTSLIIKVKGNINSLVFEVNLYSDKGMLAWADFSKYITPKNYTYLQMDLTPDMSISSVRLSFFSASVTGIESYVQVDYMALI